MTHIYSRPECPFVYCSDPENCQARDSCKHADPVTKFQKGLDGSEYTTFGEGEESLPIEVREEMARARREALDDA